MNDFVMINLVQYEEMLNGSSNVWKKIQQEIVVYPGSTYATFYLVRHIPSGKYFEIKDTWAFAIPRGQLIPVQRSYMQFPLVLDDKEVELMPYPKSVYNYRKVATNKPTGS
jgi:hypothetical protein